MKWREGEETMEVWEKERIRREREGENERIEEEKATEEGKQETTQAKDRKY